MNRRKLIQSLAIGIGGLVTIPTWANTWNQVNFQNSSICKMEQEILLAEIVDSIIPKTDTLGAKEIGVQKFVQRLISDCFEVSTQEDFKNGLEFTNRMSIEKFNNNFVNLKQSERLAILTLLQTNGDAKVKSNFELLKKLTIQGYMNSEYVMTNITHFEFAPVRFHGCVDVKV